MNVAFHVSLDSFVISVFGLHICLQLYSRGAHITSSIGVKDSKKT